MSLVGSGSGSGSGSGNDCRNFKEITRNRLLHEMLGSCNTGSSKSIWKVLIMDEYTLKIMSSTCTVHDTTSEGVSLLERIDKRRQPFPYMDAIYFIRPSEENVNLFLLDMCRRAPYYRKAFVFFSSPISKDLLYNIKEKGPVLSCRISALSEMNLEYFPIDSQGFITNNERAVQQLYSDENLWNGTACLNEMAVRIATVFASLKEFPSIRYRAAKTTEATVLTTFRDLIPTNLAAGILDCLMKYKGKIPKFPETETCELLVLDRSVDLIAPIIHEWTYDAMCHDLLHMEGNKYVYEIPNKIGGPPERKDVLLDEHDPVWLKIRHEHIGVVSEWLKVAISSFVSKNKAAQFQAMRLNSYLEAGEFCTKKLQAVAEALPEYLEQNEKLSLHAEIAMKLVRISRDLGLQELAELEQGLVFGNAGIKDVLTYLKRKELDTSGENKLRLLMILALIYPEKLEDQAYVQMMREYAKLQPCDMTAVSNMKLIRESINESSASFPLKFGSLKKGRADRKERPKENAWRYSRFYPIVEELIEKLSTGELSKEDYPCLNDPSTTLNEAPKAHSMRSRQKSTPTWAHRRNDGISRYESSDSQKMGKRIFVVIAGGATRSELRVCHQMTAKLKREVILGSSSLEDPATFVTNLKMFEADDQLLSVDDIQV